MNDDVDLIGAHAEKPARLDDFETLVDHGGGIDGDAVAHLPVGMGEGLFGSDGGEIFQGRFAEGAAGGGEDEAADLLGRAAAEALVNGVVLAIHGQEFAAGFVGRGHDQFAGGDEDFLVGKGDLLAKAHSFVGGLEADDANGGGNDDIGLGMSAYSAHAFTAVVNFRRAEALLAEEASELGGAGGIADGNEIGGVALDLSKEFFKVGARSQRGNAEALGQGLDDGEALPADGACGAENGELFHRVVFFAKNSGLVMDQIEKKILSGSAGICDPVRLAPFSENSKASGPYFPGEMNNLQ